MKEISIAKTLPKATPVSAAHELIDRVHSLVARIELLADNVCGPVPMPVETAGVDPNPDGVMPLLAYRVENAMRRLNDASYALGRLDEVL